MFICGNDAAAKAEVTVLLRVFGWSAEDIGPVEGARAIEPLCQLWCASGFQRNQWTHAFKLLNLCLTATYRRSAIAGPPAPSRAPLGYTGLKVAAEAPLSHLGSAPRTLR